MMVSVLVGAIRAEAAHSTDPATLLRSLNDRVMIGFSVSLKATCLLRLFRILLRMKCLTHMPCGGTQRMFGVPVALLKCIASTVQRNRDSHVRGGSCFGERMTLCG
jgi:hypothetical protein